MNVLNQINNMRFLLSALMLVFLPFVALAEDDYFPTHVGDEMEMRAVISSQNGQTLEGAASLKLETTVEKSGKTYVRCHQTIDLPGGKIERAILVRKDEKGAYSLDEGNERADEQIEAIFPLKAGATWQKNIDGKDLTVTVSGFEPIEISGKTYERCCHIKTTSSDGSYTSDSWEAPRLGSIKFEAVQNGVKITLTLKDFKPGK